ncbi:MAG: hypothetical protein N4A33_07395 [Bacteriovoracaceae bacterium]|jgi:hypothetical protein|nr:hypothetical protein [Bacteriovoracaceae bacterium]
MKKLLVAALLVTSAFAHNHNPKHMIKFDGFADGGDSASFDISSSVQDDKNTDTETKNSRVALNYAYSINGTWQVGGHYVNDTTAQAPVYGIDVYYNLEGRVNDTCYAALHYSMSSEEDVFEANTIGLEYGHRFNVGSWMGMHLTFAPSVNYTMNTVTPDGGEDITTNALAWNWIKFDLLF